MKNPDAALRNFRQLNRIAIAAFILAPPVGLLGALIARGTPMTPWIPLTGFGTCLVIFLVAYFRIRTFRCPRCGKQFTAAHPLAPNSRGRRCVHCGLEAYA
jgi:hypothetical protein